VVQGLHRASAGNVYGKTGSVNYNRRVAPNPVHANARGKGSTRTKNQGDAMIRIQTHAVALAFALAAGPVLAQADAKAAADAKPSADAKASDAKTPAKPAPKAARAVPPAGSLVQALQAPAWIERGGSKIPAAPGMALKAHDQLHTGAGSRLWLRTPDGSVVKMGENGALAFEAAQIGKDRTFQAAIKVLEGAFRFTTDALAKFRGKRDVTITFGTVTAGIRGTDLWGKSAADKQIVCLIEGKIELTPPGESPVAMDKAMSFYIREKDQSQPVAPVPPEQLKVWSAETETEAGKGVARRGGKWRIVVSTRSAAAALKTYEDIRSAGYAAELQPTKVDEKRVYTVQLSSFASKADADAVAKGLKEQGKIRDYKIAG
jgi:FecR-like protein/sporulation related protein